LEGICFSSIYFRILSGNHSKGFSNIMNFIKKSALIFFMAIAFGASSAVALAEEAANSSAASINETIAHIEKALVEVNKSDFSAAHLHLKAARSSSEHITGNEATIKQANASVIQGQIQSKHGDIKASSTELNKALVLYKSL
jgi:hypothetical protein